MYVFVKVAIYLIGTAYSFPMEMQPVVAAPVAQIADEINEYGREARELNGSPLTGEDGDNVTAEDDSVDPLERVKRHHHYHGHGYGYG